MVIKIIHNKDGMYDCYDKLSGNWMFSTMAADNVFLHLSKLPCLSVEFIDDTCSEVKINGKN